MDFRESLITLRGGVAATVAAGWRSFSTMKQNMHRALFFASCAASLVWATPSNAALMLAISPSPATTFYTTDGTDTLDFNITGDGNTSFGAFTLNFAITPDASNATTPLETLEFVAPPTDPSSDPTLTNGSYVFATNSLKSTFGLPFGTVSGTDNTQLTLADSTADAISDVTLGNGVTKLLATLVFTVPTNVTNPGGDKFDITLLSPNTSPTALQSNNTGDVQVSGTFMGVVTVEVPNVSPVPELGTFGMLLVGMSGMLWMKRRRT